MIALDTNLLARLLLGIPVDRDRPFWFIVTAYSGLS